MAGGWGGGGGGGSGGGGGGGGGGDDDDDDDDGACSARDSNPIALYDGLLDQTCAATCEEGGQHTNGAYKWCRRGESKRARWAAHEPTHARSSLIMIRPGIEPGERGPPRQVTVACPAPQKELGGAAVAHKPASSY